MCGVCVCDPCPFHPWETYIVDEVCHVSGAGGQHAGWWGAHPAERGVAAQQRPPQRGIQGCQLCRVAQLADVVGILQTRCVDLSLDPWLGGVSIPGTFLRAVGLGVWGEDLGSPYPWSLGAGPRPQLNILSRMPPTPPLPLPGLPPRPPAHHS